MRRLTPEKSWRSPEGGTLWDVSEPGSTHANRRPSMDRYIGLEAQARP